MVDRNFIAFTFFAGVVTLITLGVVFLNYLALGRRRRFRRVVPALLCWAGIALCWLAASHYGALSGPAFVAAFPLAVVLLVTSTNTNAALQPEQAREPEAISEDTWPPSPTRRPM